MIVFPLCVFGQTFDIVGTWKSPRNIAVVHFTFNIDGSVVRDNYGDISDCHLFGHYSVSMDSIIVIYDSLTSPLKKIYRTEFSKLENDTLFIINKNTIKLRHWLYLFNKERDESIFSVDSSGILNYKIRTFGDVLYLQQFIVYQWVTVDTFACTNCDYIDIKNYQLPLHSGRNEFHIYSQWSYRELKIFVVNSKKEKIKIEKKKVTDKINFSGNTSYYLYDERGMLVIKGNGNTVNCSKLSKGKYILHFDNESTMIKIKKP